MRSPPANRQPYTAVLSALRKIDLLRLSIEFRLSTEGPVTVLRNRLKDHLNNHRDTLFRNPRYRVLYPRHRMPMRRPALRPSSSRTLPSTPSRSQPTPTPSRSVSPAQSYESWNGIQEHHNDQDMQPAPPPPVVAQPVMAQPIIAQPVFAQPVVAQGPLAPIPSPSPSFSDDQGSFHNPLPPVDHVPVGCKFLSEPYIIFYAYCTDTMQSIIGAKDTMEFFSRHYCLFLRHCAVP